jgi:hypothetical protein
MESLSSKLSQELDHYILLKEKYNQAQLTIADILLSQKRLEAELEEVKKFIYNTSLVLFF